LEADKLKKPGIRSCPSGSHRTSGTEATRRYLRPVRWSQSISGTVPLDAGCITAYICRRERCVSTCSQCIACV